MNIKELTQQLINSGIEKNEAETEMKLLLKYFCNYTIKDIILKNKLSQEQIDLLKTKVTERILSKKPIQYIIGKSNFMGLDFIVNPTVLIPRDETELLVRKAVELINRYEFKTVIDVGTGSGCIACMVAKLTGCQVIGVDISNDALGTALDNASNLKLNNRAIFRKSNVFSNVKPGESFDMIVSNPPYIPASQKGNLQVELSFEPETALYTDDIDGTIFYKKILDEAKNVLNRGGYILFELGINQADIVCDYMITSGYKNIEILNDVAGIERVACCQYV
ncbi:MAG: peptide chain release factor N(5)-glutamine methyltransferase [Candidatus Gastranaerophilales bacterium]